MTSLFTEHDILNIHKILGFGCLAHYGYRFLNKYLYGTMLFDKNSLITHITPAIHLSLSLSSFIFQIPRNRFNSKVIIWKELQLHNIIFTSRSAFMMYHTLYFYPNTYAYYYSRLAIVLTHHYLADLVTKYYQIRDKTTTRDIPYDTDNEILKVLIKKYYAVSQLLASFVTLLSHNYENGLLIMFPIQLSTFLMTLVRKNMISNNMLHIFYAASLAMPYITNAKSYHFKNENVHYAFIFIMMRLFFKVDKYINMIGLTYFHTYLSNLTVNP
jgi:hypothetical protein